MTFNLGSDQGNVYLLQADGQDQNTYGFDYQTSSEYCYPLGYSPPSPAKSSDWTYSSSAIPASPYMESPLSSVGAHADSSWNPFGQSFASTQNSIDNGSFVPRATYSSNAQTGNQNYVSLAAINETRTFGDVVEDDEYPRETYETSPLSSPIDSYQSREPNWGSRRNSSSSSSSKPVPQSHSKRRKSSDKEARSSHSRSKSESTLRLRSTTQPSLITTFSSSSRSSKSPSSSESSNGRNSHNQVEKQYRNRLNGQFEMLLNALPSEDERDGAKSRVSKGEVLMLAKRHIVELEREKMMLEGKRQELESDVEDLKRKFVGMGGVCIP